MVAAFTATGATIAQQGPPQPAVSAPPKAPAKHHHSGCKKNGGCPNNPNKQKKQPKSGSTMPQPAPSG